MRVEEKTNLFMTEDGLCVVRGRRITHLVLCTLEENSRSKVLTGTQPDIILRNMKLPRRVYLSEEVQKLYNTNERFYSKQATGVDLVSVKAKLTIDTYIDDE